MNNKMFYQDSTKKNILIDFGDFSLKNSELYAESMELKESICSSEYLEFGYCEASILSFKAINTVMPMKGKQCTVTVTVEGEEPFKIGTYIVDSDKPTADRRYRDVVAYDMLYVINESNVADWYNSLNFPLSLKTFRNSFFTHFGMEQENTNLINDSMAVKKTVKPTELSGNTVIRAICELNGCFGHIGRDGKFEYKFLKPITSDLYPSNDLFPSDFLYPSEANTEPISSSRYIKCQYEDFVTKKISKLQIRQEENDIGAIYGTGDNCYIIENNFLVYGKEPKDLDKIASNLFGIIKDISYRPCEVEAKGNPYIEVGEAICANTTQEIIETYVLQRNLKGIQALRDTYIAVGEETYKEKVNSANRLIIQLLGKTNTLSRTVEETRLEIKDIESGLSSKITQTANSIATEVKRATEAEGKLSSKITQTAESITAEVKRSTEAEGLLSSIISQTVESIDLKVSKGDISSLLSIESGKIKIESDRFELKSTNCTITADGKITAKSIDIQGGKINIMSASNSYDVIKLRNSAGGYCGIDSFSFFTTYGGKSTKISGTASSFDGIATFNGGINTNDIRALTTSGVIAIRNNLKTYGSITFGAGNTVTFDSDIVANKKVELKGTSGNNFESSSSYAKMGSSYGYVGFFGNNGSTKKSVAAVSTSATSTAIATKLNDLLTALKAYNLIG